jgi:hypothetical protein
MKTINLNLYSYKDLSKESQEKALSKWNEHNDMPFLEESMSEYLKELLKENKIEGEPKVMYSLSYCQGDGAMFEGNFTWKGQSITITQSGRYYHSKSKIILMNDEKTMEESSDKLQQQFESLYQEICKELENHGYSIVEYELSEVAFANTCEANEYTFEANGVMRNY